MHVLALRRGADARMGGPAAGEAAPAHRARSGARTHTRGAAAARGEGRRAATEPREDLGVVRHRECDVEWCRPSLALCRLAASARPRGRGGQLSFSFRAADALSARHPRQAPPRYHPSRKRQRFELVACVGASTRESCAAPSRPGRHAERRWLAATIAGSCRTPLKEAPRGRARADGGVRVEWEAAGPRGGAGGGAAHARVVYGYTRQRARGSCLYAFCAVLREMRGEPQPALLGPVAEAGAPRSCEGAPRGRAHGALCARARSCSAAAG